MSKWEPLLLLIIAAVSCKLAYEMGAKAERAKARIEYLTERYVIDTQIADYERSVRDKNAKPNQTRTRATVKALGPSAAQAATISP